MIRMTSLLWKHFAKVLRQEDPFAEGSCGCFTPLEQTVAAICKAVHSQGLCKRALCPSLGVGLSICSDCLCRGEVPIFEEIRSEKLVICIFLLKTNRTTSQVFTVQKIVVGWSWGWFWSEMAATLQSSTQGYQLRAGSGSANFGLCTSCTVPCPLAGKAGLTSPCCSSAQPNQSALVVSTVLLRTSWHLEINVWSPCLTIGTLGHSSLLFDLPK